MSTHLAAFQTSPRVSSCSDVTWELEFRWSMTYSGLSTSRPLSVKFKQSSSIKQSLARRTSYPSSSQINDLSFRTQSQRSGPSAASSLRKSAMDPTWWRKRLVMSSGGAASSWSHCRCPVTSPPSSPSQHRSRGQIWRTRHSQRGRQPSHHRRLCQPRYRQNWGDCLGTAGSLRGTDRVLLHCDHRRQQFWRRHSCWSCFNHPNPPFYVSFFKDHFASRNFILLGTCNSPSFYALSRWAGNFNFVLLWTVFKLVLLFKIYGHTFKLNGFNLKRKSGFAG